MAIERLTELLPDAQILGIDRSSIAFQAAAQRNRRAIESGHVFLQHGDIASANVEGSFEVVFAVNVIVFWTTGASCELGWIYHRLAPRGACTCSMSPPRRLRESDSNPS